MLPNHFLYSLVAMNALFASLAWCAAKPNRASIGAVVLCAVIWLFASGPLEGRVLKLIDEGHGVTESDLLSVVAVIIATVRAFRVVRASRRRRIARK